MSLDDTQLQQPLHQPVYDRREQRPCAQHEQRITRDGDSIVSVYSPLEGNVFLDVETTK